MKAKKKILKASHRHKWVSSYETCPFCSKSYETCMHKDEKGYYDCDAIRDPDTKEII
jgi:hypothetical protein